MFEVRGEDPLSSLSGTVTKVKCSKYKLYIIILDVFSFKKANSTKYNKIIIMNLVCMEIMLVGSKNLGSMLLVNFSQRNMLND